MLRNGDTIPKPSDTTDYCITEWCVTDANDSMFVFEPGYNFAYYDECSARRRRDRERKLLSADENSCDSIPDNDGCPGICEMPDVPNPRDCITEFDLGGADMARTAVAEQKAIEQAALLALMANRTDDAACCSDDHRSCCVDASGNEVKYANLCSDCVSTDGTVAFLEHGANGFLTQDNAFTCVEEGGDCSSTSCCQDTATPSTWSMTCVSNVCEVDTGRRLQDLSEFKMERPDLAKVDKFVPYHPEL